MIHVFESCVKMYLECVEMIISTSFQVCFHGRLGKYVGSQPVSMDRENVKFLSKIDYCVCEKTDGVRYILLIWQVVVMGFCER